MKDINWKLYLNSPIEKVFDLVSSDEGRSKFWAESAVEKNGIIHFKFVNGWEYKSKIFARIEPSKFVIDYFESLVTITLKPVKKGMILYLNNSGVEVDQFQEVHAGWVSVLLTLKAAIDHGIDLRNHDPSYCWDQGFVDN